MVAQRMFSLAGVVATLGLLGHGAEGVTVLLAQRAASLSGLALRSAEWRAAQEVEAEGTRFWVSEWNALEAQLHRFRIAAAEAPKPNPAAPQANADAAAAKPSTKHSKSPLAGLKLNLNPKTTADLLPTLAMLKGLYQDGKERIGKLNAMEKDAKHKYDEKQALHQKRLDEVEARFKNHTLSAEFRTNETRDENRLWSYWERVREGQHKQFHTSLKIQHATLDKVKKMVDMYEKTIAGKTSKSQVAKQLAKVGGGGLPEVVLLQEAQRAATKFCDEALAEVHAQEVSLLQVGALRRSEEV